MKQVHLIKSFEYDSTTKSLNGRIKSPKFNTVGAELFVEGNLGIEGLVVETFSIIKPQNGEHRVTSLKFEKGDWFVKIQITKGHEFFERDEIKKFTLKEKIGSKTPYIKPKVTDPDSLWVELRNMSGKRFGKYYMDIRGGETGGVGRNEHGAPHFHIIEFNTNKDLGKAYFPSTDANEIEVIFECKLKLKEKKKIEKWIFENDKKILIELNKMWFSLNKFNNRVE